jgi:hypothetical protein
MRKLLFSILALILVLALALPMAVPALAQSASLWTDKQDYAPEEVVTISGSGFLANAEVAVTVERPDGVRDTVIPAPVTDDAGYFTCSYQLDGIAGTYVVTATDGTNTAVTTFTDKSALISITVSPTSVAAGSTTSFTVNVSVPLPAKDYDTIGSIQISMAAVSASNWGTPGSVSISGFAGAASWSVDSTGAGLLKIKCPNSTVALQPGETMTVTFSVQAPSETGNSTWSVTGYNNVNFSGHTNTQSQNVQVTGPFRGYLYALRGGDHQSFWRYDIGNNTWTAMASTSSDVDEGGALAYDGTYIYALRGDDEEAFWRYDIGNNTWTAKANTPADVNEGGALTYDGTYIYALRGDDEQAFWRYDIGNNTWTAMNQTPADVEDGGALVYDGSYIYALRGDDNRNFWRYDIGNDTWTAMNQTPSKVNGGGALTYDGTYIYALRGENDDGDGTNDFWRYDIGNNTWTAMADTPEIVNDGGALTYDGTYIYALAGDTDDHEQDFWRYDITNNTWSSRADTPENVGWGGALCAPLAGGDTTPPLVNITFPSPVYGQNGWFNAQDTVPVVGTVTATDPSNVTAIDVTGAALSSVTGLNTTSASGTLSVSAEGINSIVATATDGQGNSGAAAGSNNTATIKIDTVLPTLTKVLSGTLGLDGWYTSDVTVNLTGADATSGLNRIEYKLNAGGWTNYTANFTISTEGTTTLYHRAYDNAGNVNETANQSIKIDKTAPVVTITAPAEGGIYQTATLPALAYTVNDNLDPSPSVVVSGWSTTEGAHTATVTATDDAGNVGSDSVNYTVDNTPPVVTITAPAEGGYYQTATLPALAYNVTDNLDPSPSVVVSGWSTAEGAHTATVTATDAAGNVGSDSVNYTVDNTPPVVNITAPAEGGVYQTATVPALAYNVTDNLDPSPTVVESGWSNAEGAHTATVTATDAAGNVGSDSVNYTVNNTSPDTTPPTVNITFPAPDGANGWFKTKPVVGTVTANDTSNVTAINVTINGVNAALSGVTGLGTTNASATFNVTAEGTNNIAANATDGKGNSGAAPGSNNTTTIKIDTVAPVITITVPNGTPYELHQPVNASWSASDPGGSGIASATGTVPSGSAIDTGTIDGKTFNVTATDNAGNTQTTTVSYSVEYGSLKGLPVLYQSRSSSVLIRWQYTDYYGNVVDSSAPTPVVTIVRQGNGAPVVVNNLVYDSRTYTWQFNWPVRKSLTNLSYRIWIETGQQYGPFFLHLINGWLPERPMW